MSRLILILLISEELFISFWISDLNDAYFAPSIIYRICYNSFIYWALKFLEDH